MSIKRVMDAVYSARMLKLLKDPFRNWDAYKLGIINDQGDYIKKPESVREKAAYTSFHSIMRTLKQSMQRYGGNQTMTSLLAVKAGWKALTEQYGEPESTLESLCESMVAGDSGGSVSNIASGVTTGDVTNVGPSGKKIVKRKKLKVTSPIEN